MDKRTPQGTKLLRKHLPLFVVLTLLPLYSAIAKAEQPQLRGIWMHATQIKTPSEADEWIAKIDRANLNAAFMLVWYWGGQAFFHTELCPMGQGVQENYDPLGYMVEHCHRRGIEVHAWFVNGAYGAPEPRHLLDKHPDWIVDDGAGSTLWYDFGKLEVRRFQSDLMIECLRKYVIDGLHFDYIRYGPHYCYCRHCQEEFARRYGFEPITTNKRKTFPIAAVVSANTLTKPTTATILAEFSDRTPAIALNKLGKGVVLLLNWHAVHEMPPAVGETVKRAMSQWTRGGRNIYVTTTTANRDEYGARSMDAATVCLGRLGYRPKVIDAGQIAKLASGDVLVLPAVYIIPKETAEQLELFVRQGGKLLVIDGPVRSMQHPAIQRVLGFATAGPYVHRDEVIQSTGRSLLAPRGEHKVDLEREKVRAQKWSEFRKWGVTELVRDVYRRAKKIKPDTQVTAAVRSTFESAEAVYQDWPGWLKEGIVDYVIPMAYTENTAELASQIAQWKTVDPRLKQIVPGLSIYQRIKGRAITRDLALIRKQHRLCTEQGARGNMFFSLHYLNEPLIDVFRTEFYPSKAPAHRPLERPRQPIILEMP